MYCDNCNKEITQKEAWHISNSRELNLLADSGGSQNMDLRNNKVCWECICKASKLIAMENKELSKQTEK